jgi:hypothetical protein
MQPYSHEEDLLVFHMAMSSGLHSSCLATPSPAKQRQKEKTSIGA